MHINQELAVQVDVARVVHSMYDWGVDHLSWKLDPEKYGTGTSYGGVVRLLLVWEILNDSGTGASLPGGYESGRYCLPFRVPRDTGDTRWFITSLLLRPLS